MEGRGGSRREHHELRYLVGTGDCDNVDSVVSLFQPVQAWLNKTKENRNARLRCTAIRRPGLSVSCEEHSEASKAAFWLTDWP